MKTNICDGVTSPAGEMMRREGRNLTEVGVFAVAMSSLETRGYLPVRPVRGRRSVAGCTAAGRPGNATDYLGFSSFGPIY